MGKIQEGVKCSTAPSWAHLSEPTYSPHMGPKTLSTHTGMSSLVHLRISFTRIKNAERQEFITGADSKTCNYSVFDLWIFIQPYFPENAVLHLCILLPFIALPDVCSQQTHNSASMQLKCLGNASGCLKCKGTKMISAIKLFILMEVRQAPGIFAPVIACSIDCCTPQICLFQLTLRQ